MNRSPVGTVYLLHFDRPYRHARHYLGWATDPDARLTRHAAGEGARLLEVVHAAGIGWTLARTWVGTRESGTPAETARRRVPPLPVLRFTPRIARGGDQ